MSKPVWVLALLGGVDLGGPDAKAAERVLVQPKHACLLSYLAVEAAARAQPTLHYHRRDDLATLLWPELDQEHARASLRRVVHQIREALGSDVLISRGDEELALNGEALTSDVALFVRDLGLGRIAEALDTYRGNLMPGFRLAGCGEMERRLEARRTELRQDAGTAALTLAQSLEADDKPTLAARWARKVPAFVPDDERVLRRALSVLDRVGDRAGALRVYDEFARRLREEFDATPSAETLALITRIRG